jgi:hypothetical protein
MQQKEAHFGTLSNIKGAHFGTLSNIKAQGEPYRMKRFRGDSYAY